jgi:uncharacterized phiE125 gp8 family phage protein
MGLTLVTAPAAEHVTLVEAKSHLRVEVDTDDGLIAAYVLAARQAVEDFTRRKLYTQTWDYTIDSNWPTVRVGGVDRPRIVLPLPPLQSVSSITYYDGNGALQTLATSQYRVDATGLEGRIEPAYNVTWPTVRDQMSTITVRMVVGYTTLPEPIRHAILLTVGNLYKHRESVVTGTIAAELPQSAQMLLFPYRVFY